jgi:hypothetical protein
MSPEPDTSNLTSPKGDATMPDDTDDATTAASHNPDGVSTVPKDPAEAEAARTGERPPDSAGTDAPLYDGGSKDGESGDTSE